MTSTHPLPPSSVATATIIGRGRLGRSIARALRGAGITVAGPTARGETVPPADVILICVPDDEIVGVIAAVGNSAGWVGHTSGATPVTASGANFGLHPLQTFVGDEDPDAFHGIGCAVSGSSPAALAIAQELASRMGAHPFPINDEHRAGYHAAASIASNYVVTLLAAAEQVAATAGLPAADARALLAPLVRTTVENWAAAGPAAALTGPIARGDEQTAQRQRDAVAADVPELLPVFDALAQQTRSLVARKRAAA